eukprot:COSAG04_NODE_24720_length_317_cov_2.348624_1_plen_32_part_01
MEQPGAGAASAAEKEPEQETLPKTEPALESVL